MAQKQESILRLQQIKQDRRHSDLEGQKMALLEASYQAQQLIETLNQSRA
jgi:hypothetical protein